MRGLNLPSFPKGGIFMENNGILREDEMIFHLNNRVLKDLPNNLQDFILIIFGILNLNTVIKCKRVFGYKKPDFRITVNGLSVGISMKSGCAHVLHVEDLLQFLKFLYDNGVSKKTLNAIRLFHYGDGTYNGTGKDRMNCHEAYEAYKEEIDEANKELNSSKELILKVMNRVVFDGFGEDDEEAEYLYHGSYKEGVFISRGQFKSHIMKKDWESSPLRFPHIGPFMLLPERRYPHGRTMTSPERRHRIEVNMPHLKETIKYIAEHNPGYTYRHKKPFGEGS